MDRFLDIKLIEQQLKPYIDTLYDVDVIWQDDFLIQNIALNMH